MVKRQMQINHLRNYYSDFVFYFLKKHIKNINKNMKVLDVGAGHLRNLKIFEKLGFVNLYAIDREKTDNPLDVTLKDFKLKDIREGLPYSNKKFDIVLCNFVLMFIEPEKMDFVVNEILRVSKNFILIETNEQKCKDVKNTFFKQYDFKEISNIIHKNENFKVLKERMYYQKILIKRVD